MSDVSDMKYGIVVIKRENLFSDDGFSVEDFVGYSEPPTITSYTKVYKEIKEKAEKNNTSPEDWVVLPATDEMIEHFKSFVTDE